MYKRQIEDCEIAREGVIDVVHPKDNLLSEAEELIDDPSVETEAIITNVWQRVSDGLNLYIPDDRRVDVQKNWYLKHPEYMKRVVTRAKPFLYYIVDEIEKRDMPMELVLLPIVESAFDPFAYSHGRAAGMWQFIRTTGQRFMRIDNVVDERMDPYTATYAAMSLLEYNYNLLGSWPLALTAYNHGAGGLARAVRATGTDDIATIISQYKGPSFGFASRNFYPQFLAVLDVERRARALFGVLHLDVAPEYLSFELDTYVEANVLADALGVSICLLYTSPSPRD